MDNANQISSFIESVGIPLATALALGGCAWWLLKYILNSVVAKIGEAQAQTEADIKELKGIIVQLIDKTTLLQGDLIRLDTLLRVRYGLDPDEKRIARSLMGRKSRKDIMDKINDIVISITTVFSWMCVDSKKVI